MSFLRTKCHTKAARFRPGGFAAPTEARLTPRRLESYMQPLDYFALWHFIQKKIQ